jgi:hypothetical protein
MARRAQSSINPTHLLGLVLILAVLGGGGYTLLHRTTDPMTGITELLSSEFLENATALSGNLYKVEGVVDDRLDTGWRQSDGRLFSVQVSDGSGNTFVPLWVPPDYEGTNIQRGQRYTFKVRVQENGILEVIELIKI